MVCPIPYGDHKKTTELWTWLHSRRTCHKQTCCLLLMVLVGDYYPNILQLNSFLMVNLYFMTYSYSPISTVVSGVL